MDDQNIIALYWARSETAISETAQKYGGYCFSIAKNILTNHEDAEESVNDTYLTAWNAMPQAAHPREDWKKSPECTFPRYPSRRVR